MLLDYRGREISRAKRYGFLPTEREYVIAKPAEPLDGQASEAIGFALPATPEDSEELE